MHAAFFLPPRVSISGGAFRTLGTLRHEVGWDCGESNSGGGGGSCRRKRSVGDEASDHADLELHLSTREAVLPGAGAQVRIRLRRSPPLLAPDYKLVVRGGGGPGIVNRTVPFPACLYTGEVEGTAATVAVSTCQENKVVIEKNSLHSLYRVNHHLADLILLQLNMITCNTK